ncbi:MAG: TetR/AcrR family transcriptional regulator, partial [Terrimesophilobacter sp.]
MSGPTALLRNEPVQARSTARLSSLLDAAAAAIDDVGYERLTTAMVADRAGASIGTVYRYFPDRIAVLESVASRAIDRFTERITSTLAERGHTDWWSTFDALIDDAVGAFAHEPAFAAVRFGDVLDLRPRESGRTGSSRVAAHIAPILVTRHGLPGGDELAFHLEVVFTLVDGLLARAFAFSSSGDGAYISEARKAARSYLVSVYGEPTVG